MLDGLASAPGLPLRGITTCANAEFGEVVLDALLAVAAVGGHGPGRAAGAVLDPVDRRREQRRVGGVAPLDGVVHDHAVVVVDELRLVAELDRLSEPALGDRTSIRVVQADPPCRRRPESVRQPLPGLGGDLTSCVDRSDRSWMA